MTIWIQAASRLCITLLALGWLAYSPSTASAQDAPDLQAGDRLIIVIPEHSETDALEVTIDEQHVARWAQTETPSMFGELRHREFFHELVARLAPQGFVRLLQVVLDGQVVAAHLGFVYSGRFIWYKPTFDPALAHYSPGEVLLRQLILDARDEDVAEFDFTVGDEAFKQRVATRVRTIVDLRADRTENAARLFRGYLRVRDAAKGVIGEGELWQKLRRFGSGGAA